MIVILLLASIVGYVITILGMGELSKRVFTNTADQMFFQSVRNAISLVLIVLIYRAIEPSGFTIGLSIAMGFALLFSAVFSIVAYQKGPVSISIMITSSLAMVISSLAGPIFWKETISIWQIIGVILSVASMMLLTEKTLVKSASISWIIALILSGVSSGMQGVIQKILAMSSYANESKEFVTYSIAFYLISTLLIWIFVRNKNGEHVSFKMNGKIWGLFILQAMLYVFLNVNNLKLVSELPTVIFFPSYMIGGLLITTVASIILFKEKISKRQWVGFAIGIIAILLISGTIGHMSY